MTKQEAIEVIERLGVDSRGYPKLKEALDMAIEALQRGLENVVADSCSEKPNRSDTIYRQDAIEAVDVKCLHRGIVKGIQEIIEDLPSAQPEQECEKCIFKPFKQFPERKKGHWIKISPANIYECSECGKNVMTDDIIAYDFCHGCGAEMIGESNG